MYDINFKNVKKGIKIYNYCIVFLLFFLAIFIYIPVSNYLKFKSLDGSMMSSDVIIKSEYDDDKEMYRAIYYFDVDGNRYSCQSSSLSSISPVSSNKIVYYDTKNPSKCMTEDDKNLDSIYVITLIILFIVILLLSQKNLKIVKRIKNIKELNTKGKLVKNLPYLLEDSGIEIMGHKIQVPYIYYKLKDERIVKLKGDPRYDKKIVDSDGMVDLIIDEDNPDNYYIDFEINRLSGNLPEDYSTDDMKIEPSTMPNKDVILPDELESIMKVLNPNEYVKRVREKANKESNDKDDIETLTL